MRLTCWQGGVGRAVARDRRVSLGAGAALALCVLALGSESAAGQSTTRVSVASGGVEVPGSSNLLCCDPAISGDGRFVAFSHEATNLVPDDTNASDDIFVNDRFAGTINAPRNVTTRVSVGSGGVQAMPPGPNFSSDMSRHPAISADARFVAFASLAGNLVADDTNNTYDIFVRDRSTGTTNRVSLGPGGVQANADSVRPAISADGRFVAFESRATNLVAGDTNLKRDVFVHDRATATTTRVSLGPDNAQANDEALEPAISADGRFVAFHSSATNLVADKFIERADVFVHDRQTATTTRVSVPTPGTSFVKSANSHSESPAISADGRFVAFDSLASNLVAGAGDQNNTWDIFVHDRAATTTTRVSVASGNIEANHRSVFPAISADGRFIAFESLATNLVTRDVNARRDVFVHDQSTGNTTAVSVARDNTVTGLGLSGDAEISADGRFVAFRSNAPNLIANDTNSGYDYFVRDRGVFAGFTGVWERVTLRCAPQRPARACTVGGRLEITNPGNRTASASRLHIYLSDNRRLDGRDRLIRKLSLTPLRGGRTTTVKFKRGLKQDVSGRFLIARLDATGKVKEPNEKDNVVVSEPLSRKRIRLQVKGAVELGTPSTLTIKVTDARGRPIRDAAVSVSGAGLRPLTKHSPSSGTATFRLPPLGKGTLEIRASRRGYATLTVHRRVR